MDSFVPKKLALIRIWQILKEHSDFDHPMTQEEIAEKLKNDYGIVVERKAIGRNLSLLKEAGIEIGSGRGGAYLEDREFEDSELHMLIDGVLSSKYITAHHSKDLIDRLCGLSNKYFRANVRHIHSVNEWSKTDNQALFYNIELIDKAIEEGKKVRFDYNKYGIDKKLHRSSKQVASPYLMLLHNQQYYLMAYNEYWSNMGFYRLDHITDMAVMDETAYPLTKIPGYKNGIDYKELSTAMPYMYTDKPEPIEFLAETEIVDQVIDWFGKDIRILKTDDEKKVRMLITASPNAMLHWAVQYVGYVEILSPDTLRQSVKETLKKGLEKYK